MGLNVLVERQKGPVLVLHESTEAQAEINSTTSVAAVAHLSPSKIKGSAADLSQ